MSNMDAIKSEMESLVKDGLLQAEDIVEYAKSNRNSAIREAFDSRSLFNDKVAAEIARLSFARHLIQRVRVRVVQPNEPAKPLRVFVNLTEERPTINRGYRHREDILSDQARLGMFRRDFGRDVEVLILRYADLLSYSARKRLREIATEIIEMS